MLFFLFFFIFFGLPDCRSNSLFSCHSERNETFAMYQFMLDFLTWQTSCYKDGAILGYLLKFKAANLQEK